LVYRPIEEAENKAEEIERCYRQIRLAYEARGEYPDAGDFYLLEMNARKRRLKGILKRLHYLYGWVSNYGESVGRAFAWLFGTLVSAAVFFAFAGFEKSNEVFKLPQDFSHSERAISTLFDSLIAVLHSVTMGRLEPYKPINTWGSAVLVIARVLGLSILTLLLLAIRRRFRR